MPRRGFYASPPHLMSKSAATGRWLLLFHQIPPKPDYFRVKVWRRLHRADALQPAPHLHPEVVGLRRNLVEQQEPTSGRCALGHQMGRGRIEASARHERMTITSVSSIVR